MLAASDRVRLFSDDEDQAAFGISEVVNKSIFATTTPA
jgi:hypothetical protein